MANCNVVLRSSLVVDAWAEGISLDEFMQTMRTCRDGLGSSSRTQEHVPDHEVQAVEVDHPRSDQGLCLRPPQCGNAKALQALQVLSREVDKKPFTLLDIFSRTQHWSQLVTFSIFVSLSDYELLLHVLCA